MLQYALSKSSESDLKKYGNKTRTSRHPSVRSFPVLPTRDVNKHQHVLHRFIEALLDHHSDLTVPIVRLAPTSVFNVASLDSANVIVIV